MEKFVLRLLSVGLALWLGTPASTAQTWDRDVAPGILFRMERQANPPRNTYGLRIDPKIVRAESTLGGDSIYDLSPNNGRRTMSRMVQEHEAIGGVNGDYFQFGGDPGGDPSNLMVHGGELLSQPGSGPRGVAVGWDALMNLSMGNGEWTATFSVNGGPPQAIAGLNTRTEGDRVTLSTDSAGYAYAPGEATAARVQVGAYRLSADRTVAGTVLDVVPLGRERLRVAPGEMILSGSGKSADAVRSLRPGDTVRVTVRVTGFDWNRVQEVIGGGPILLQGGKNVLPSRPDNFNDTRHPRTAMGRTADGHIWFLLTDGRQSMSVGATVADLAEILQRWGCTEAINLDGGGSSAMNLLGVTLNRPSGGIERAVANGVLLYGRRPASSPKDLKIVPVTGGIVVGTPVRLSVTAENAPVPVSRILFTAQGAGWIDQEGMFHPEKEGTAEVTVLVDGATAQIRLTVTPRPTAPTP